MEKISKLHCEANPNDKLLLRIFIDDELIADMAESLRFQGYGFSLFGYPSPLSDRRMEGFIYIRLVGEYILWIKSILLDRYGFHPPSMVPFDIKVFHRKQYLAAIGADEDKLKIRQLSSEEFHYMIWPGFPIWDEAIYTTPSQPADPRGDRLIKSVYKHFFDVHPPPWSERVEVTAPPEQWEEIRIGLERDGFPEAVWRVGRTPTGIAVWFVEYPSFPLWLCGEHVDRAFAPFIDAIIESTNGNVKD